MDTLLPTRMEPFGGGIAPADTVLDGWEAGTLTVRAASSRGRAHRLGVPRQDDLAIGYHAPTGSVVAAVCDGVSAASLARRGAAVVARQVVAELLRRLSPDGEVPWEAVVAGARWAIFETARAAFGAPDDEIAALTARLATTLCAAVISPTLSGATVTSFAIGDSGCGVIRGTRVEVRHGGKVLEPDDVWSNVTDALPGVPPSAKGQRRGRSAPVTSSSLRQTASSTRSAGPASSRGA